MAIYKQLVGPFAVRAENRKEPFSGDAEAAAVFVLSELERKSGGLLGKQESMDYILKVGYPLLFIVKDNFVYVFDGLNKAQYNWTYYEAAQTEFSLEEFETNFRIREEYIKFLEDYQSIHQTQNSKEIACNGLIVDKALFEEMHSYCKETTETYNQTGLITPRIEESEAAKKVNQIETLQLTFKEKTEKLNQLSKLISKTTKEYIEGFNFEAKVIAEEIEAKIKAQKEIINPKIEKITTQHKKQIDLVEKNYDKIKHLIDNQKNCIEKDIKKTEINIEQCYKQLKLQAGNKRSEDRIKKKLKEEKQQLKEHQKQQKTAEDQLRRLTEQKTKEAETLKDAFSKKVQLERQPIIALEILCNNKQDFFKQESQTLEELTQPVIEEINRLIDERQNLLTTTEELGLKLDLNLKSNTIMYVPFYIAAYNQTDSKAKRYFVFSPCLVSSLSFSSKLKSALGRAKIKDLFNERFRAVSSLGEKLRIETSSNKDLEAQIELLAQKNNLLELKTTLKDGLRLLKEEGWLSETDHLAALSII